MSSKSDSLIIWFLWRLEKVSQKKKAKRSFRHRLRLHVVTLAELACHVPRIALIAMIFDFDLRGMIPVMTS